MHDLTPREGRIMEWVGQDGFVAIDGLAQQFNVTPQITRGAIHQPGALGLLHRDQGDAGLPVSVENIGSRARTVMQ